MLIPNAAFEQHIILLGKTRSGKSSAIRYMVEHLLDNGKPVCIVDPKGDHWGLKASSNGKKAGYPIVIFGGEHADVPLNARSGAAVAELLATGNRSAIVDLGGWMPGDRTQFWIDFASTYFRTHRGRHYLVLDEIHNFCFKGKVMSPDAGKMLHWANRLASEGLGKGISMIAASQRPQKVHNDFLTSCETLIAMRVIHAADRGALSDWIDGCGDEKQGKELISTIASMKRGEAWAWSPEAEFGPKRLQFPMFKTYDSFRPRGAQEAKLKGWAEVDLEEVKKKLQQAVKEAEANDPNKLRHRIRELEAQVRKGAVVHTPAPAQAEVGRMIRHAQQEVRSEYREVTAKMERRLKEFVGAMRATAAFLSSQGEAMTSRAEPLLKLVNLPGEKVQSGAAKPIRRYPITDIPIPSPRTKNIVVPKAEFNGDDLTGPESKILLALAELRSIGKETPPKSMVAAWACYSPNGGAFINPLGALRSKGLVDYPQGGTVALTEAGQQTVPTAEPPDQSEINRRVQKICTGPEQKIIAVLLEHGPEEMTRAELAERAGYAEKGGAFVNPLGALRTKGLVEYPRSGLVKPVDWLFIE